MRSKLLTPIVLLVLLTVQTAFNQDVKINEIMTLNVDAVQDEDSDYPDWIELFNAGNSPVNMNGFGLSDDPDEPLKWVLPEVVMNPGEFILVFASRKDRGLWADFIETIIWQGDTCKYRVGDSEPPGNWKQSAFDDSDWLSGTSGFGFGDEDDATIIPQTISVYIRKTFTLDNYRDVTGAILHMDYDDAFVAYLNNTEIARQNIGTPGIPPAFDDSAALNHEALIYQGLPPEIFIVDDPLSLLNPGLNVLAVQVHNSTSESSDLTAIPFLTLGLNAAPDDPRGVPDVIKPAMPSFHTNFSVRSSGEPLTLADSNGRVLDSLESVEIQGNLSYGRVPDGGANWLYMADYTPGASNSDQGWTEITDTPDFAPEGGLYPGAVRVSLLPPSAGSTIYYTLDGSDPDENSIEYTAMISIDTTTVVKAVAYQLNQIPSDIETHSYIIGYSTDIPVISLSTDPPNLWDENTGIYVLGLEYDPEPPNRGANFWQDWERPVHIEFFEPDGSLGFSANGGVKIHGGWTRFFAQKSLALFARAQYGDGNFNHQIFPDLDIDRFEAIVLRNSGSDWDHTMFRDPMMVSLVDDCDLDIQAYRPSLVFLNGAFWGIYNIREKKNEHFIASHHDIDPDSVDIMDVWGGIAQGDDQHYTRMMDFLHENDLSDQANYEYISDMMDIDNFIAWNVVHIYVDNTDWPGNNNEFWRPKYPGGKWRWFLFDTDFGFALHDPQAHLHNTMEFATNSEGEDWPNPAYATFLLRKLLDNSEFRVKFINRFADMMNFNFLPVFVTNRIEQIKSVIDPYIVAHLERWERDEHEWTEKVNELYDFAEQRPEPMRGFVEDYFGLSGNAYVTVDVSPVGSGKIQIDTRIIPDYPWTGIYFKDVPITFTALPADSNLYRFVRWSGATSATDRLISLTLDDNVNLSAIFERLEFDNAGIVINEINYNSAPDFDTEDWIELHSISGDHDLSGFVLRDDSLGQFVFPAGTMLGEGEYLTVIRDSVDFFQHFPDVSNVTGSFEFGLNNAGDQVRLFDPSGALVDSVAYDDMDPWPIEADGSGATLELVNPLLPNEVPENWRASILPHGSPEQSNIYHPPSPFTLAYPGNGSIVNDDTVTVQWSASIDPDTGDVVTYFVEWSLSSDFIPSRVEAVLDTFYQMSDDPSIIEAIGSGRSIRSVSDEVIENDLAAFRGGASSTDGLPDGMTVFWRVKAVDNRGLEVVADPGDAGWLFVVNVAENHPPSSFSLAWPPDSSVMHNDSVLVKWTTSTDPDEGDEIIYQVEWSLASDYMPAMWETTTDTFLLITDASVEETGSISMGGGFSTGKLHPFARTDALPDSHSVYWRVRAVDSEGLHTAADPGLSGWMFDILLYQDDRPEIPLGFEVGTAYPNPFNSRFKLPIELSEPGEVKIIIYDLFGNLLHKEILDLDAGYHDFLFIDDDMEVKLATGMFFIQVHHEGKSHAQKVLLLR